MDTKTKIIIGGIIAFVIIAIILIIVYIYRSNVKNIIVNISPDNLQNTLQNIPQIPQTPQNNNIQNAPTPKPPVYLPVPANSTPITPTPITPTLTTTITPTITTTVKNNGTPINAVTGVTKSTTSVLNSANTTSTKSNSTTGTTTGTTTGSNTGITTTGITTTGSTTGTISVEPTPKTCSSDEFMDSAGVCVKKPICQPYQRYNNTSNKCDTMCEITQTYDNTTKQCNLSPDYAGITPINYLISDVFSGFKSTFMNFFGNVNLNTADSPQFKYVQNRPPVSSSIFYARDKCPDGTTELAATTLKMSPRQCNNLTGSAIANSATPVDCAGFKMCINPKMGMPTDALTIMPPTALKSAAEIMPAKYVAGSYPNQTNAVIYKLKLVSGIGAKSGEKPNNTCISIKSGRSYFTDCAKPDTEADVVFVSTDIPDYYLIHFLSSRLYIRATGGGDNDGGDQVPLDPNVINYFLWKPVFGPNGVEFINRGFNTRKLGFIRIYTGSGGFDFYVKPTSLPISTYSHTSLFFIEPKETILANKMRAYGGFLKTTEETCAEIGGNYSNNLCYMGLATA